MSATGDLGLRVFGDAIMQNEIFSIRVHEPDRTLRQDPFGASIERMERAFLLELTDAMLEESESGEVVLIEEPVDGLDKLAYEPDRVDLFGYVVFNPFGPTLVSYALLPVPERNVVLLVSSHRHTVHRDDLVHAALPAGPEAGMQAGAVLEHLLGADLAPAHRLAGGSVMDVVVLDPDSPLEPQVAAAWFQRLALLREPSADELHARLDEYAAHPGDPWTRAQLGLERGMRAVQQRVSEAGDENAAPPDDALLRRWWAAVSDRTHAARELAVLPSAWAGAIRFTRGDLDESAEVPPEPQG